MNRVPSGLRLWLLLAVCLPGLGGCVTATVQQVREASTGIADTDAIVVLGRKDRPSSDETEMNFVRCVGDRMGKGGERMNVISEVAYWL